MSRALSTSALLNDTTELANAAPHMKKSDLRDQLRMLVARWCVSNGDEYPDQTADEWPTRLPSAGMKRRADWTVTEFLIRHAYNPDTIVERLADITDRLSDELDNELDNEPVRKAVRQVRKPTIDSDSD